MKYTHSTLVWPALALTTCWAFVLRACYWEWSLNAQYSYGALVPLLSVLLFARRWPGRPEPAKPSRGGNIIATVLFTVTALTLAALQPLVISNADWRMLPAMAGGCGAGLTLAVIFLAGGAPWLRHFAFPVLFFLVAVPWPRAQESAIMSWLMTHNTALCVEVLHWLGYAAEQRGNLIAIPGSLLGVEEACSGIRSLQSMIMISLAVGEFFGLAAARRVVLLFLGLGAALAGNAIRSLALSVAACRSGSGAVDAIHDGTGLAVLAGASAVVLLAGRAMAPKNPHAMTQPSGFSLPWPIAHAKPAAIALLLMWAVASFGGEAWFRWHEATAPAAAPIWTLAAGQQGDNAREVPIAARTLDILLYPDAAKSEQWRDDNGWQWQSFFFHWPPGPTSVQSAFVVHDPRVCLGAAGFELESPLPDWTAEANGFRIPFQRYLFRDRGRPVHVFHAVVEDDGTPGAADAQFRFDAKVRWNNLLVGRRNQGLRVLEFAVRGPADPAEAEAAATEWLKKRIAADRPNGK
jgi:exosortase